MRRAKSVFTREMLDSNKQMLHGLTYIDTFAGDEGELLPNSFGELKIELFPMPPAQ